MYTVLIFWLCLKNKRIKPTSVFHITSLVKAIFDGDLAHTCCSGEKMHNKTCYHEGHPSTHAVIACHEHFNVDNSETCMHQASREEMLDGEKSRWLNLIIPITLCQSSSLNVGLGKGARIGKMRSNLKIHIWQYILCMRYPHPRHVDVVAKLAFSIFQKWLICYN